MMQTSSSSGRPSPPAKATLVLVLEVRVYNLGNHLRVEAYAPYGSVPQAVASVLLFDNRLRAVDEYEISGLTCSFAILDADDLDAAAVRWVLCL